MFNFLVGLLYPKKCIDCRRVGEYVCDDCFVKITFLDYQICSECQKGSIDGLTHPGCKKKVGLDGVISAIAYKGLVKKLLYQFKYPPYLSDLRGVLSALLYEGLIQQPAFVKFMQNPNIVIVPVPLHPGRARKRGYNQAELLAYELSKRLGVEYPLNVLERIRQTKPQFKLSKKERKENIDGAFALIENLKLEIKNKNIILIDDITTSGVTLRECAKVLKKGGAGKVLGITLAHEG